MCDKALNEKHRRQKKKEFSKEGKMAFCMTMDSKLSLHLD
jgi:hypothetical protein